METMLYIIVGWSVLFVSALMFGKHLESKRYNKGICPNCGTKLEYFDIASDGSRGYICKKCGYDAWCSYDVDK